MKYRNSTWSYILAIIVVLGFGLILLSLGEIGLAIITMAPIGLIVGYFIGDQQDSYISEPKVEEEYMGEPTNNRST